MARELPSGEDLGRRLAAARAYRRLKQAETAERLGIGADTLGRYETTEVPKRYISDVLDSAPRALKLPEEFFVIDFEKLPEMVEAWRRTEPSEPSDLDQIVDESPG